MLRVTNLNTYYGESHVLRDVSVSVNKGEVVVMMGPNGHGKSTLLKTSLGLVKPISGQITFFQQPLKKARRRVAYVPQRESVDWDFPITVFDLVLMGRYGRRGIFKSPSRKDRQDVKHYLAKVGMESFAHRQISQLSGGQQQRAFLARALIQEADLYLMDEPFTGIDISSMKTIITILRQLRDEGKTLLVVHHDLASVEQIFDWVVLLNMCLVGCGTVKSVFTPEMIRKTYGKETVLLDEAAKLSQEKSQGFLTI